MRMRWTRDDSLTLRVEAELRPLALGPAHTARLRHGGGHRARQRECLKH